MSITAFFILIIFVFLIVGGVKLNRYLAECGALVQEGDKKKKKTLKERSVASILRQEIKSNIFIKNQLQDQFGPYHFVKVEETKGYPIWVTVYAATDNGGSIKYSKYLASISKGWQQSGLSGFTEATSGLFPLEEDRLNKMMQRDAETQVSVSRRFIWNKIWDW